MPLIDIIVSKDRMGNVYAEPTNPDWRRAFGAHVAEFTGHSQADEQSAFFQEGDPADAFVDNSVPPPYRADLHDGWPVVFGADPWVVGHWYGYDAQVIAE